MKSSEQGHKDLERNSQPSRDSTEKQWEYLENTGFQLK